LQDRPRESQAGEGELAEVSHHRGVGEEEEGFGDERSESGKGEAEDFAVDGSPLHG